MRNSVYNVIRGLIAEHGIEFLINCGESLMTVEPDNISFHSYITGDDTTIREDTPITFDAERNEFVWYDWDGERDVEYRAKPYLELTRDLADAFATLHRELAAAELDKLGCVDPDASPDDDDDVIPGGPEMSDGLMHWYAAGLRDYEQDRSVNGTWE